MSRDERLAIKEKEKAARKLAREEERQERRRVKEEQRELARKSRRTKNGLIVNTDEVHQNPLSAQQHRHLLYTRLHLRLYLSCSLPTFTLQNGDIVYPILVGTNVSILNLGTVTTRLGYHTYDYIFPVEYVHSPASMLCASMLMCSYKSQRKYTSTKDPDTKCLYTCEILDGGSSLQLILVYSLQSFHRASTSVPST